MGIITFGGQRSWLRSLCHHCRDSRAVLERCALLLLLRKFSCCFQFAGGHRSLYYSIFVQVLRALLDRLLLSGLPLQPRLVNWFLRLFLSLRREPESEELLASSRGRSLGRLGRLECVCSSQWFPSASLRGSLLRCLRQRDFTIFLLFFFLWRILLLPIFRKHDFCHRLFELILVLLEEQLLLAQRYGIVLAELASEFVGASFNLGCEEPRSLDLVFFFVLRLAGSLSLVNWLNFTFEFVGRLHSLRNLLELRCREFIWLVLLELRRPARRQRLLLLLEPSSLRIIGEELVGHLGVVR